MASFNAASSIGVAIRSVLYQDYPRWELLIVDDGSTDDTPEILLVYRDPRIKLFRQENQGVSAARNRALSEVSGSYFTFLDADDCLPPNSLSARVAFMEENPKVDVLSGAVGFFSDGPEYRPVWCARFTGDPLRRLVRLESSVFCNPSYFLRAAYVGQRFDTELTHCEDWLFLIRLATKYRLHFDFITQVVYWYRLGAGGAMHNLRSLEKCYWQLTLRIAEIRDPRITFTDRILQRIKVCKILLLSHLRRGDFLSALGVLQEFVRSGSDMSQRRS